MKRTTAFLALALLTLGVAQCHRRRHSYIHERALDDSFMGSLEKHLKNVTKSTKDFFHGHAKDKFFGSSFSSKSGDKSTVVSIKNGHKITKYYEKGKLVRTKKEKVKDHGNSINMSSNGGKNVISIQGGGGHVTQDKFGNIQINSSSVGKHHHSKKHGKPKHHKSHKDHEKHTKHKGPKDHGEKKKEKEEKKEKKKKEEKEKKKEKKKKEEKEKKEKNEKKKKEEEKHDMKKKMKDIKKAVHHFIGKLSRGSTSVYSIIGITFLISLI